MATSQRISTLELAHSVQGDYAQDFKAASLAAKLADTCVSASYLPDLWTLHYERFFPVVCAELSGDAQ
jgi:hypothetical protein